MGKVCFEHFLAAVYSILMQKTAILMYFWCFFTILHGLNYWATCKGARGTQESKKIEIAKNELKRPQTII